MARDPKEDNPSFSLAVAIAATKLPRLGTGVWKIPKGSGSRPLLASWAGFRPGPESRPKHGIPVGTPIRFASLALDRLLLVPS